MAGTKREIVGLYYDFVAVSVLGNVHVVNMLIIIPLKIASQHFNLHKLFALPTRILEIKFNSIVHDFA